MKKAREDKVVRLRAEVLKPHLARMVDRRYTIIEMASELGLGKQTVVRYLDLCGMWPLPYKQQRKPNIELVNRAAEMASMRKEGLTLAEIAGKFDVTRERVRQVLSRSFPDTVWPGIRVRNMRTCKCCGQEFCYTRTRDYYCSAVCRLSRPSKAENMWHRENAVAMMRMRDEGATWEQIAQELGFRNGHILRSGIRNKLTTLFSREEQAKYFPTEKRG